MKISLFEVKHILTQIRIEKRTQVVLYWFTPNLTTTSNPILLGRFCLNTLEELIHHIMKQLQALKYIFVYPTIP